MKKVIYALLVVLLLCSPCLAAAAKSGAKLPLGLSWKDTEKAIRDKLTRQELSEIGIQQRQPKIEMEQEKKKSGNTETTYGGKVLGADAWVTIEHNKRGIESVQIAFAGDMSTLTNLPAEVQNLPETLTAELGEPYKGTDSNVWSRVPPRRFLGNVNVWYLPSTRHLVWVANTSPYIAVLSYSYVEKSLMFYYILIFVVAVVAALAIRGTFSRQPDYFGYAGNDDETEE